MSLHTIDIDDVVREYRRHGGHFFDPDTMRFFRSRLDSIAERGGEGRVYFVTSEKRTGFGCADGPRTYTVRVMDWDTGTLQEASPFHEDDAYRTKRSAEKARERFAEQDRAGAEWPCSELVAAKLRERGYKSWSEAWRKWRAECVEVEQRKVDELRAKVSP